MSFSEINNTNINSIGPVAQPAVSQTVSGSGSNVKIDLVDEEKQKLLKRLNITSDELQSIQASVPDFVSMDTVQQLEIVKSFRLQKAPVSQEPDVKKDGNANSLDFDRAAYNSEDKDGKIKLNAYEFAKNIYIYGIKDRDGNTVKGLVSHSPEEWNKLSPEEQQKFINNLHAGMASDEKLKSIAHSFFNAVSGMSDEEQIGVIDTIMRVIQTANSQEMSILEFFSLDEYAKMDATEKYLKENKDTLNSSDQKFLSTNDLIKSEMVDSLKKRGVGVPEDASISDIAKYAEYCNLDPTEELLNKLKDKKAESGLSEKEEKVFKRLSKFDSGNGKNVINKSKAAKLAELENEFNKLNQKLNSGELLSAEEQEKYNLINNYLNSDDAKYLKEEVLPNMRKPETDYEKSVYNDIEEFKNAISGYCNDTSIISAAAIKYIESKTEGLSPAEKEKYISTFLDFNNDTSSVGILKHYGDQFTSLYGNENLISESTAAVDADTTVEQLSAQSEAMKQTAKNGNKHAKNLVLDAAEYRARIYKNKGTDKQKDVVSKDNVELAESKAFDIDSTNKLVYDAIDINISMEDPDNQLNAQQRIEQSDVYNTEVRNYTTDHIGDFHTKNQIPIYETAITGDKDAAAHASENGSVSSMASENQNDAFDLLYNRLNEYFEGDDAIKYLNNLSDQIQDCDKGNQLAMHNQMMGSQYSEVQEHAAGNIGNYDPSVQADAMDSVYASGNQNAIEAAVESITNSPSSDVVQQEIPRIVMQAAEENSFIFQSGNEDSSGSVDTALLQQKILSGAKLTPQEYATLSSSQKREYFVNYFKKLPLDEKIKMLSSLPNGMLKKSVYTAIARMDSNLFTAIVKDKDRADMLLGMGLPDDVNQKIDKIVSFLAVSDVGYQNIASKYDITYGEDAQKNKSYATNPEGLDYKDILKKDKYGNILA